MATRVIINSHGLDAPEGTTLFDAAARLGIVIPSSCGQQGKCRECLIEVIDGDGLVSAPVAEEAHLKDGFRLSCRCRMSGASGVVRCRTLRRGSMQIEEAGVGCDGALPGGRPDPAVTRDGEWVLLDGEPVERTDGPLHGVAIDAGTTTVVLRLLDLESGAQVAATSFENPQRFGGSDVMARISYDTTHGGRFLQAALLSYLARAIMQLPVDPRTIYEFVVAGNTTMRDLFFGIDVHPIGQKPYRSITEAEVLRGERANSAVTARARALRLPSHREARVYGLPLIGSHVGGDAAACLLAIGPHRSERLTAIMDIGTNTELVVGNRHRLLAASCPAGPAFEGRSIACGMPGLDGAIARVAIDDSGRAATGVIGGGAPEGICGSGLVDLLGELLRTGRINEFGRFTDDETEFVVDGRRGIVFRESDINELAQAKGANVAGLRVVASRLGIGLSEIEAFHLAGGFGRHIDLGAARRIGLIPNLPDDRIFLAGNAAIEGATLALLSSSLRREVEDVVPTIEHVELETDPAFFDRFVAGCQFRALDATEEVLA